MMKLNVLALLGIVAALGMSGCGKKKADRARRDDRGVHMKKDHRNKKPRKDRKQKREMRRDERNMFAK